MRTCSVSFFLFREGGENSRESSSLLQKPKMSGILIGSI